MPKLESIDRRAVARAAKGLAARVRRRGMGFAMGGGPTMERFVRRCIEDQLAAIEDDDLLQADEDRLVWARVERSGLVLVGVGDRAYIVARVAGSGGRAQRLLVR